MISVIIPVYKVEQYLDACVESVVHQTYTDLEIILVDDGSPDGCPALCDRWAKKDSRIKVVHKKNGGLSSARNAGLAVARGEYIGFVDSDDYVDTAMYEDLMRVMLQDEKTMVVSSPIIRNTGGVFTPYKVGTYEYKDGDSMTFPEYMQRFLEGKMDATVWNKLYKREFIQVLFREGRNNEDYLFMYYNAKQVYDTPYLLAVSATPHYYYRSNPQSICHQAATSVNRLFFDVLYNMDEIAKDLQSWNLSMQKYLIPHLESILILGCDQIIKYPILRKRRPEDCRFIDGILKKYIKLFSRKRPMLSTLKFALFKYAPSIYKLVVKLKLQS